MDNSDTANDPPEADPSAANRSRLDDRVLVKSIELSHWKSFDERGIVLDNLGPVNVLIGPNNCGKSNLFRFLRWIRNSIKPFHATESNSLSSMACDLSPEMTWRMNESALPAARVRFDSLLAGAWRHDAEAKAKQMGQRERGASDAVPFDSIELNVRVHAPGKNLVLGIKATTSGRRQDGQTPFNNGEAAEELDPVGARNFARSAASFLVNRVFAVDAFRDPARKSAVSSDQDPNSDGGNMVNDLLALSQSRDTRRWLDLRRRLETLLKTLMSDPSARLDATAEDGKAIARVTLLGGKLILPLADLGSGVVQAVMLYHHLWRHAHEPRIALIEEPETNLHPGAAALLVKTLAEQFPMHQYLITTHGTAILDGLDVPHRLYRFSKDRKSGATSVESMDDPLAGDVSRANRRQLVADLGLNPSQFLLANTLVWVEGVTDAHYLRAMLASGAAGDDRIPVYGRDYSFVFFGGAMLSGVQFGDDDAVRLVRCLHVSHRNVVVHDLDDPRKPKPAVVLLRQEAERIRQAESGSWCDVFDTAPGREIENLIAPQIMSTAVRSVLGPRALDPLRLSLSRKVSESCSSLKNADKRAFAKRFGREKVRIALQVIRQASMSGVSPFRPEAEGLRTKLVRAILGEHGR